MNKRFVELLTEKFSEALNKKTGWGKNEVLVEFQRCVVEAALELLDNTYREPDPIAGMRAPEDIIPF